MPFSNLSWHEDAEKDSLDGVLDLWRYERSLLSSDPSLDAGLDSFCHTPFVAASYVSDLSRVAIPASPNRAKHDSLSLNDSSQYTPYGRTLP